MIVHKKKAPKHAENQGMLDLAAAGARDADETEVVDLGDEEELDESLIDEDDE